MPPKHLSDDEGSDDIELIEDIDDWTVEQEEPLEKPVKGGAEDKDDDDEPVIDIGDGVESADRPDPTNPRIIKIVPPDQRQTSERLTRYEIGGVLGLRCQHLSMGAVPYISNPEQYRSNLAIALAELKERVLPYKIIRPIGSGRVEIYPLRSMVIGSLADFEIA